jgi:serine/threonine protein phosphatase PrpC
MTMGNKDDEVGGDADPDGRRRRAFSPLLGTEAFRPSSAIARVEIGAQTDIGAARAHNDQHYLALRLGRSQETLNTSLGAADLPPAFDEYAYALLVADGLGESGSGAVASRVAVSTLAHLAMHYGRWNVRIDDDMASEVAERAEWFYRQLDEAVVRRSRTDDALSEMATTLTVTYSSGDRLFVAHVGHSRAYLFSDGTLRPLTTDQTLEHRLATMPGPQRAERTTRDLQHILTDAIGGPSGQPHVEIEHYWLKDRDRLLLCSNGLCEALDDDRLADILTFRRRPKEDCQMLVDAARRSGSEDTVTVLVADYHFPTQ